MRLLERRMQETSQAAEWGRQNKTLQKELAEKEQQLLEVLDAKAGLERRLQEVQEQLLREHKAMAAEKLTAQEEHVAEYNGLATEFNDLVQELESAKDNQSATESSRDYFQAQLQQAVQENAELKRTVEFMMARQAAWAATGPMRGPHPNYEQRRAYAHAPQGMAGVGSQALPAAMGHPFHHQGPGVGGMPFPMTAPGFPAPVYTASAPGQAFPPHLGLAPNASSHLRVAAATRSQVPMGSHEGRQAAPQGPTATRQQLQAQAQGPSHVEQQQRFDHAAVQGPSQGARQTQQAGAAQPSGAQGLEQGSAQPTAQPTHQDRTGQAPVQSSHSQQVGIQFGSFGQGENAPLPSSSNPCQPAAGACCACGLLPLSAWRSIQRGFGKDDDAWRPSSGHHPAASCGYDDPWRSSSGHHPAASCEAWHSSSGHHAAVYCTCDDAWRYSSGHRPAVCNASPAGDATSAPQAFHCASVMPFCARPASAP
eukprot:jgi/Astpho2/4144/fgenesh1_pg.00063_%23_121_t